MRGAVFGFFPDIGLTQVGGVQVSGRLAWGAVAAQAQARGDRATLLCYGSSTAVSNTPEILTARTKTQAIRKVLRVSNNPQTILVWHLGLLKLIPFLRARGARLVVFLHGIEAWRKHDAITRHMLHRTDLFLSNSAYTHERFLEYTPEARDIPHRVVPLGVGAPETEMCAPQHPPAALILGRLDRSEDYKGHRELIGAWRGVREKIPQAVLWIAGDGNLRSELEHLVHAHGLGDAVQFWGRVSDAQKEELLDKCRCLAMPSRGEGFGIVYLEAMRRGRPCLVGACDGGHETVNPPQAGLAVNPSDQTALIHALAQLLANSPAWEAWSQQARTRYETDFTGAQFQERLTRALALPD